MEASTARSEGLRLRGVRRFVNFVLRIRRPSGRSNGDGHGALKSEACEGSPPSMYRCTRSAARWHKCIDPVRERHIAWSLVGTMDRSGSRHATGSTEWCRRLGPGWAFQNICCTPTTVAATATRCQRRFCRDSKSWKENTASLLLKHRDDTH